MTKDERIQQAIETLDEERYGVFCDYTKNDLETTDALFELDDLIRRCKRDILSILQEKK